MAYDQPNLMDGASDQFIGQPQTRMQQQQNGTTGLMPTQPGNNAGMDAATPQPQPQSPTGANSGVIVGAPGGGQQGVPGPDMSGFVPPTATLAAPPNGFTPPGGPANDATPGAAIANQQQLSMAGQTEGTPPPGSGLNDAPPPPPSGDMAPQGAPPQPPQAGIPQGFTQGQGADSGAFYYGGNKVSLTGGEAMYDDPSGQAHTMDGAALQRYIDSPAFQQQDQQRVSAQNLALNQNSTNPEVHALYNDPEFKALQAAHPGGFGTASDGNMYDSKTGANLGKLPEGVAKEEGALNQYAAAHPSTAKPPTGPTSYLQNGLQTDANGQPVKGGYNALSDLYRQQGTTPGVVNPQVLDLVKQNPALAGSLPPEQSQLLQRSLASQGVTTPNTPGGPSGPNTNAAATPAAGGFNPNGTNMAPNDTNMYRPTGPAQQQRLSPSAPSGPGTPPAGGGAVSAAGGPGSNVSAIDPANDLRSKQITDQNDPRTQSYSDLVDQQAGKLANVDRYQLAQDEFNTYSNKTDPAYDAAIRKATDAAAAHGTIGSGMLTTDYGNLALQRGRDLSAERDTLFQNALEGSIGDQFNKTSALSGLEGQARGANQYDTATLRGERGYQTGQEQNAYNRALQQYETEQGTKQQQFNNSLELLGAGEQGNPAGVLLGAGSEFSPTGDEIGIGALAQSMGSNTGAGGGAGGYPGGGYPSGNGGASGGASDGGTGDAPGTTTTGSTDFSQFSPEQIQQLLSSFQGGGPKYNNPLDYNTPFTPPRLPQFTPQTTQFTP